MPRELSANERALREIMRKLREGAVFGKAHPHRGYYFERALWYGYSRSAVDFGNPYIYWQIYSQGACKPNLRELNWVIRNMFRMTPGEFLMSYTTRSRYKVLFGNAQA